MISLMTIVLLALLQHVQMVICGTKEVEHSNVMIITQSIPTTVSMIALFLIVEMDIQGKEYKLVMTETIWSQMVVLLTVRLLYAEMGR